MASNAWMLDVFMQFSKLIYRMVKECCTIERREWSKEFTERVKTWGGKEIIFDVGVNINNWWVNAEMWKCWKTFFL